jgi:hypothetical protein
MITDNDLRLSGSRTAAAAAYTDGVPSGYPAGQDVKAASVVSTNSIDLSVNRDIGAGENMYMVWTVTTAFARGAGAINTIFQVLTDDDAALGSPTVRAATGTIAKANLALGTQIALAIPPLPASLGERYLGARVLNADAADAANVVCDVVLDLPDGVKFYPSGFSLS